jgi:hypothetical protein
MNPLALITDSYERKARIYPALLVVAPIVAVAMAMTSTRLATLKSLGVAVAGCGGAFLLAQLARAAGKKNEHMLFAKWGGLPSVAIFRHRDSRLDSVTKARYHKTLGALVKGAKAPSVDAEQADPAAADEVYMAWSTYLRVNLRGEKKDPLLFKENQNYGYCRNVWGLRPFGISTSALSCVVAGIWCYGIYRTTGKLDEPSVGAFSFALLLLLLWLFRFSSNWVRIPAEAYAARLAEATDSVGSKTTTAKKT